MASKKDILYELAYALLFEEYPEGIDLHYVAEDLDERPSRVRKVRDEYLEDLRAFRKHIESLVEEFVKERL